MVICCLFVIIGERDDPLQSISVGLDGKKLFVLELYDKKISDGQKDIGLYCWCSSQT